MGVLTASMVDVGEKVHAPSARWVEEARQRGRFPSSPALASAVALLVGLLSLGIGADATVAAWGLVLRRSFESATQLVPFSSALASVAKTALVTVAMPLVGLAATGVLIGLVQSRGRWWPGRRERFLRDCFDRRRIFAATRGIGAFVVLASAACALSVSVLPALVGLYAASSVRILSAIGILVRFLWLRLGVIALALGVADYLWERHAHAKFLRMSDDELKRDQRETEGDPFTKAERRRLHQETLAELVEISDATLVVMGAALAVAVRYDGARAPRLAVKMRDAAAERLLSVARSVGVPVLVRADVAVALSALSDGAEVPVRLYDVLAQAFIDGGAVHPSGRVAAGGSRKTGAGA